MNNQIQLSDDLMDHLKVQLKVVYNEELSSSLNVILISSYYKSSCRDKDLLFLAGFNKFYKFVCSSNIDPGIAYVNKSIFDNLNNFILLDKIINMYFVNYPHNAHEFTFYAKIHNKCDDININDSDSDEDIYYIDKNEIIKTIKELYKGNFVNFCDSFVINANDYYGKNVDLKLIISTKIEAGYITSSTNINVVTNDYNLSF